MARNLTNLAVYMTMNNEGLRKGAQDAKNIVSGMGSGLAKMAAFGGVTLSAAGAVVALKKVYSALGDIADGADRLGVTTTAYQELRYAAGKTGATMEQVEMATTKAGQAMEKAADGDKKMVAVLRQIGLTWRDLAGLSPDKQLEKIGSALAKVEDATKRNNIALEIFGRGATKLNPLFNELARLRKDANSLGIIIDDETVRRAEAVGDAFDRLGNRILALVADPRIMGVGEKLVGSLENAIMDKSMVDLANSTNTKTRKMAVEEAISTAETSGKYSPEDIKQMKKAQENYSKSYAYQYGAEWSDKGYNLIDRALTDIGFENVTRRQEGKGLYYGTDRFTERGPFMRSPTSEQYKELALPELARNFKSKAKDLAAATEELKATATEFIGRELNPKELQALEPKIAELKAQFDAIAALEGQKRIDAETALDKEVSKYSDKAQQDYYLQQMKTNSATEGQIELQKQLFSLNKDIMDLSADQLLNLLEGVDAQTQMTALVKQQKEAENFRSFTSERFNSLRQMALKIGGFDQQSLIEQRLQEAYDKKGAALTGGETDMVSRMARLEQQLTTMPALKMISTESSNNDLARRGGFQSLSRSMSDAERINRAIESNTSRTNELLRRVADELQIQGLI